MNLCHLHGVSSCVVGNVTMFPTLFLHRSNRGAYTCTWAPTHRCAGSRVWPRPQVGTCPTPSPSWCAQPWHQLSKCPLWPFLRHPCHPHTECGASVSRGRTQRQTGCLQARTCQTRDPLIPCPPHGPPSIVASSGRPGRVYLPPLHCRWQDCPPTCSPHQHGDQQARHGSPQAADVTPASP